ncbi:glycosyltransferase family 4 protein [Terrabacter terrigena]|uniref:D-inositol 3-phosphate glycosyltransferase n=1 Tax=Terrabacter terrigena TaxID=574718 RepID=A0ABW3MWT9_9MICO
MMRIGLVNHYAVPPTAAGGTRHWDLASEWDLAGHEVVLLASSFNHFEQTSESKLAPRTQMGQRSALVALGGRPYEGNGIGRALGMLEFAWRVLRSRGYLSGVDVVIGSSPHPFAAVAAAMVARIRRVPFVYEVRDLWPQTLVDMGAMPPGSFMTRLLYLMERRTVRVASGLVYLPPEADRYFTEKGMELGRALHAPNSAPPFEGPKGQPAARVGEVLTEVENFQRSGVRVFCYAGTIGRANGLGPVVDAFLDRRVRDRAALVVCGDGPERAGLEARLPRDGNVIFAGHVSKSDAFRVVDGCDVALFHLLDAPVFKYGLSPNKLVDYLSIGKPILYAGPSVPNPTTGSGATIDAVPGVTSSMVDAVDTFIQMDEAHLRVMAAKARRHASEHYSTSAVAERYAKFLDDVVSGARRPAEARHSDTNRIMPAKKEAGSL